MKQVIRAALVLLMCVGAIFVWRRWRRLVARPRPAHQAWDQVGLGPGPLAVTERPPTPSTSQRSTLEYPTISKKFARLVAVLLVAFGLPAGVALAGQVTFPGTFPFVAGSPIRAAEVNATFTAVKTAVDDNATRVTSAQAELTALTSRVTALEAAEAARKSYYAEQAGTDANASVDDTWVNVPSAVIPLTLTAPTNIRYQLFARVYNFGAAAGAATSCSVRIVQDDVGTPLVPLSLPGHPRRLERRPHRRRRRAQQRPSGGPERARQPPGRHLQPQGPGGAQGDGHQLGELLHLPLVLQPRPLLRRRRALTRSGGGDPPAPGLAAASPPGEGRVGEVVRRAGYIAGSQVRTQLLPAALAA